MDDLDKNYVLQNFPFLEDDFDALTDYELFCKGFEYLDNEKLDKDDLPDTSSFITKDVNNLTYYYDKDTMDILLGEKANIDDLSEVATTGNYDDLTNKPTIPDVSNFITKDVNDLTYYTLTTSLSTVATSGDYGDLLNKPTIPTIPTNVSSFNNDSGYITKSVDDLTNYTTSSALTTLLSNKEDISILGSNTNGNYLKLANGVLIQWNKIVVDDQAITGSYGSLFQGTRSITFPIAFVGDLPTVQCSEFQHGSGASWGCVVGNSTTLTETLLRGWDCFSRDAGTNCRISWIAIGKWK